MSNFTTYFYLLLCNISFAQYIKESQVPLQVKEAFNKSYSHETTITWERNDLNYEAEYGENRAVLIDSNGVILADKNEILPRNLPETVLNYFYDKEPKVKILEAQRVIMIADKAVYFLVASKHFTYKFDPLGNLLSKQEI